MVKVMVFTNKYQRGDEYISTQGSVTVLIGGHRERYTNIKHVDLHNPLLGFEFKELRCLK